MNRTTIRNSMLLFTAAVIWGVAFVAQSVGMDYMGPFTFNGTRFLLGGIVLLPLVAMRKRNHEKMKLHAPNRKVLLFGGICCGLVLCAASTFQQFGIMYTTVGKAGFITTLYIILVPVLGIFMKKKVAGKVWIGALIAAVGYYLLCMHGDFVLSMGDGLVFVCAILFSVHILVIDYFSPKADGVALSCIQFLVAGIICLVLAFLFEEPRVADLWAGLVPLLYTGILSSGVAYTLQIVGQKDMDPTVASLILSMESVVSALAGWAILGQGLSARELFGCVLVFAAVILVQLPEKRRRFVE